MEAATQDMSTIPLSLFLSLRLLAHVGSSALQTTLRSIEERGGEKVRVVSHVSTAVWTSAVTRGWPCRSRRARAPLSADMGPVGRVLLAPSYRCGAQIALSSFLSFPGSSFSHESRSCFSLFLCEDNYLLRRIVWSCGRVLSKHGDLRGITETSATQIRCGYLHFHV